MSLFYCLDLIEEELNPSLFKRFCRFFLRSSKKSQVAERELLLKLQGCLLSRIRTDNYKGLIKEIKMISLFKENYSVTPKNLDKILYAIFNIQVCYYKSRKTLPLDINQIAHLGTGDYRTGSTDGECHGYTLAMADPNLSPYLNQAQTLNFNRQIYDYQRSQKRADLHIQRERLTRKYFCPNLKHQAVKLLEIAEKHKNSHLAIHLGGSGTFDFTGHAAYLCVEPNNKIRYMDCNYGAYLFKTKEEFIAFYVSTQFDYLFYEVEKLVYSATGNQEKKTWAGKFRSVLTGPKYPGANKEYLFYNIIKLLSSTILFIIPGLFFPFLTIPILIMFSLFSVLEIYAATQGIEGLFALPYAALALYHTLKQKFCLAEASSSLNENNDPAFTLKKTSAKTQVERSPKHFLSFFSSALTSNHLVPEKKLESDFAPKYV